MRESVFSLFLRNRRYHTLFNIIYIMRSNMLEHQIASSVKYG